MQHYNATCGIPFKSINYWHPSILTYDSYYVIKMSCPWWRHQMETFSALLAICAGNSLVSGEFPAQRPVTRSFDVFFDSRLNKQLSKQSWAGDLIRYRAHYDDTVMQWCDFIPHHIKCIYIYIFCSCLTDLVLVSVIPHKITVLEIRFFLLKGIDTSPDVLLWYNSNRAVIPWRAHYKYNITRISTYPCHIQPIIRVLTRAPCQLYMYVV